MTNNTLMSNYFAGGERNGASHKRITPTQLELGELRDELAKLEQAITMLRQQMKRAVDTAASPGNVEKMVKSHFAKKGQRVNLTHKATESPPDSDSPMGQIFGGQKSLGQQQAACKLIFGPDKSACNVNEVSDYE